MSAGYGVPQTVWSHSEDSTVETTVGCAMCVFEDSNDAPLTRVFYWGGASYCVAHLKALQEKK